MTTGRRRSQVGKMVWGGGSLYVPRHVCSLSNPVALFPQHGDVDKHEHTDLAIHKQMHKENKGEGVQFQAQKRHRES